MARRPKIGDVIEIPTKIGLGYAQYTHKHGDYGALMRIFDKTFAERPANPSVLERLPIRFSTFLPLGTAINRKVFEIVWNLEVRSELQEFPTFRACNCDEDSRPAEVWFLWDGDSTAELKRVKKLTKAQRKMPILECWNDTALVEAIETGWRPESDPR